MDTTPMRFRRAVLADIPRVERFYSAQGWLRGAMKNETEVWFRLPLHRYEVPDDFDAPLPDDVLIR